MTFEFFNPLLNKYYVPLQLCGKNENYMIMVSSLILCFFLLVILCWREISHRVVIQRYKKDISWLRLLDKIEFECLQYRTIEEIALSVCSGVIQETDASFVFIGKKTPGSEYITPIAFDSSSNVAVSENLFQWTDTVDGIKAAIPIQEKVIFSHENILSSERLKPWSTLARDAGFSTLLSSAFNDKKNTYFILVGLNPEIQQYENEKTFVRDLAESLGLYTQKLLVEKEHAEFEKIIAEEQKHDLNYLDHAGVIVLSLNADFSIMKINNVGCQVMGYSSRQLTGQNWIKTCVAPRDQKRVLSDLESLVNQSLSRYRHSEYFIQNRAHNERFFSWRYTVLRDEQKNIIEIFATGIDLTPLKREETQKQLRLQELIEADKNSSLSLLVGGMAHEINNPNNFIKLNIDVLADINKEIIPFLDNIYKDNTDLHITGLPYEDVREKLLEIPVSISGGVDRIVEIVRRLRNFAKGDREEKTESIYLHEVIKTAVSILENKLKKSTYNFSIHLSDSSPQIHGHFVQLEQVFMNILLNACQALPSPTAAIMVETKMYEPQKEVLVTITDQGIGIDKEHLGHIFSPFYSSKTKKGIGSGLGLVVAKKIIENHHGRISISSKKDEGTRVDIFLPLIAENYNV